MKLSEESKALVQQCISEVDAVSYSPEAAGMVNFMLEQHMKDLFGKPEVFFPALEGCRAEQEALAEDLSNLEIPGFVKEQADLEKVQTAAGNWYFVLSPKGTAPDQTHAYNVVYSHGGGFMLQIKEQWDFCCLLTQELDATVTVPVYPLIPTGTMAQAREYMVDVYRDALSRNLAEQHVFMGDSAGGWMSLALGLWAHEEGLPQPKVIIPVSPCTDLSAGDAELRAALDPIDPMISPWGIEKLVEYWAPECTNLEAWPPSPAFGALDQIAPIHIFVGGREVLMTDALMLKEQAAKLGADVDVRIVPGMWHCFAVMLATPECHAARKEILEIIQA